MANFGKKMPTLADYENPQKDFVLPDIPTKTLNCLHKKRKLALLKKRVIEKVKKDHADIPQTEYNNIISNALYKTTNILQPSYKSRPHYFNFINRNRKNSIVVLEIAENKRQFEIVTFFRTKEQDFWRMLKKTKRDGGQSIITDRQGLKGQQAASALPLDQNYK
jgi:hypothetical protein